jgi:hypothetical protein
MGSGKVRIGSKLDDESTRRRRRAPAAAALIYLVFARGGASLFPPAPDGEGPLDCERRDAFEPDTRTRRGFPGPRARADEASPEPLTSMARAARVPWW